MGTITRHVRIKEAREGKTPQEDQFVYFQCEDVNSGLAPGFILVVVPYMRHRWIEFWKAVGLDPDEMRECTNYDVRQFNGLELIVEYALRGVDTTRQQWFATRFSPATKAPS